MRVTQISVQGLFGVFDHVIPLNLEDRVTIIHGPNGVGKTVLLKMIAALFNEQYLKLHKIPFSVLSVTFDDKSIIRVFNRPRNLKITFPTSGSTEQDFVPELLDAGGALPNPLVAKKQHPLPDWLSRRQQAISVIFVETQRLLFFPPHPPEKLILASRPSQNAPQLTIEKCSQQLSDIIQSTLAESAEVSQSLERTFPSRLVQKAFSALPETELRTRLNQIQQEQNRLASVGLLTNGNGLEFQSTLPIDEQNINALSIYVQDAQKKLGVFDKLADRLGLFKKIIEQKFLYKKLSISKEQGIVFQTPDGQIIPLSGLSSGEQHELVLLYELLFSTKPGSLILIDEPEISLHLAWQKHFLRDLQQIAELSSFDVMLATHSPQIIHDRWDLTVELKGPAQ